MNLTALSLVRATGRVPPVPTNAERARALRAALPAPSWNAHEWPHHQAARYAREQGPRPVLSDYSLRRGF